MMRYQRVSPDYNPLSNNGSKSSFRCREEGENGTKTVLTTTNGIESGFRFRSPSKPPPPPPPSQENNNTNHYNHSINNNNNNNNTTTTASASPLSDHNKLSNGRGGDVLLQLQWGHKKRARLSRTEIRSLSVNDDSSSSSPFHRRAGSPFIDKPPPPPPHSHPSNATSTSTRPSNLRTKDSSGFINNRNIEDRPAAANGSPSRNAAGDSSRGVSRSAVGKRSPHSSEKLDKKIRKDENTTNGSITRADSAATTTPVRSEQETRAGAVAAVAAGTSNTVVSVSVAQKVNAEVIEWPKIYVALSRKEKEDDFLAMKGTKLPHRPKKRAKNIDRTLQYCFPGMWLSDLTKSRYEVREKKSVKKQKRRGLKGMESMESDSE